MSTGTMTGTAVLVGFYNTVGTCRGTRSDTQLYFIKKSFMLLIDGVLRNFDLGKVSLCLFVRGKLG